MLGYLTSALFPVPCLPGVASPAEMHQIWKDLVSSQSAGGGAEDGPKGTANGIGLAGLNGLGLAAAGNPLLQGHMLGMNGLTHEAFPFAGKALFSH